MINPTGQCYFTQSEIQFCVDNKENMIPPSFCREASYTNTNLLISIELVKEYQIDAGKIQVRYPHGLAGEKHIDLSYLGLKHLPPHVVLECISATTINLTGNDIHWLPEELKKLKLERLDISGNNRLQPNLDKFPWLLEMPSLILIANNIGFDFIPSGWNGRFESNQISTEYDLMSCTTQIEDVCEPICDLSRAFT